MTYKIQIDNAIRDTTVEETEQINAQIELEKNQANELKTKREAVLVKLGLTADELAALFA